MGGIFEPIAPDDDEARDRHEPAAMNAPNDAGSIVRYRMG
jgi:hypothetical protein